VIESFGTIRRETSRRIPPLLAADRSRDQHPLHVQAAARAVGPETHLPLEDRAPHRLLRRVVRQLDTVLLHERPKLGRHRQEVVACGCHLPGAERLPIDQEIFGLDLQSGQQRLEGPPLVHSVPDLVPTLEKQLGLLCELLTDLPGLRAQFGEPLEVPCQVSPTELVRPGVEAVGASVVGDQDSNEGPQELPGDLVAPPQVDEECRHQGGRGHPQPSLLAVLVPAGFVGVQHARQLEMRLGFSDGLLVRPADLGLADRNGIQADVQTKEVQQQCSRLALAELVDPRQQRRQRMHPGSEGPVRSALGQRRDMHLAAPRANAREELDLVELGLDDLVQLQPLVAPGIGLVAR